MTLTACPIFTALIFSEALLMVNVSAIMTKSPYKPFFLNLAWLLFRLNRASTSSCCVARMAISASIADLHRETLHQGLIIGNIEAINVLSYYVCLILIESAK